jgi:hypothetical protein
MATLFLIIPGFTILALYCRQMAPLEGYLYLGPMNITGIRVESSTI